MRWFTNLQTSSKLLISFGIFIVIIGYIIMQSMFTLKTLSSVNNDLYTKHLSLVADTSKMDDNNNNIQIAMLSMLTQSNKANNTQWLQMIKNNYDEQTERDNHLAEIIKNDPKLMENLQKFEQILEDSRSVRDQQFLPAINQGQLEVAKNLLFGVQAEQFQKMSDIVELMIADAKENARIAIEYSTKEFNKAMLLFIATGILALILGVLMVYILNRLISKPLEEISWSATKIGEGDLNISKLTSMDRDDEVGTLSKTFQNMTNWLQSMALAATEISKGNLTAKVNLQSADDILGNAFQTMIKNLNRLTEEISEAINFLGSSSSEIASAATQLSSSAAETATSISETTSTIEEVKQTSQVASNKAKIVSETAKKTASMSQTGKKVTDEISDVIGEIHNQMNLIAETMMRLSEQSQTVGVIISTVEDLAQQTNLLAVNASIEASKAGEQGKGFSVVAQEVKSLAAQSKQATSQVKSILGDIQKATSDAVMATEMGSKAVEAGVKKTKEAGATIHSLVETVTETAQAASQIAAVSHQQLIGMEQATVAMENIKQASGQNVESAKLLNDSVKNIKSMGERLKQLMLQFTLEKVKTKHE